MLTYNDFGRRRLIFIQLPDFCVYVCVTRGAKDVLAISRPSSIASVYSSWPAARVLPISSCLASENHCETRLCAHTHSYTHASWSRIGIVAAMLLLENIRRRMYRGCTNLCSRLTKRPKRGIYFPLLRAFVFTLFSSSLPHALYSRHALADATWTPPKESAARLKVKRLIIYGVRNVNARRGYISPSAVKHSHGRHVNLAMVMRYIFFACRYIYKGEQLTRYI